MSTCKDIALCAPYKSMKKMAGETSGERNRQFGQGENVEWIYSAQGARAVVLVYIISG